MQSLGPIIDLVLDFVNALGLIVIDLPLLATGVFFGVITSVFGPIVSFLNVFGSPNFLL